MHRVDVRPAVCLIMVIRDIYLLRQSDPFYLPVGHEASVNLALTKAPPLPCTKLFGRVVSGCESVSGATVKLLDRSFKPLYHTETDSEGGFSFIDTLMPGVYELVAVADGYLVSESVLISLTPSVPLRVTIRLVPDGSAEFGTAYGVTRDERNAPLPGVQVFIFSAGDMAFPTAVTVSNTDGEYLFYRLKPGKYVLRAFLQGYYLPQDAALDIYPEGIARAELYLFRKASAYKGTVSGKVTHNGAEVPNATAALYLIENGEHTLVQAQRTNSKGFYLFSGCKPGEYVVKAKLEGESAALCADHHVE